MRVLVALLVIFAVIAGIVGPQLLFVVDETQVAILTRFGEPRKSITNPGLYTKTPFIETVTYFEKRILVFDAPPDSLLTEDKKRLVIDVYARGRIVDPLLFFRTVRTETQAASRAVDILSSELRREIALDEQIEIIQATREDIMNRVRDSVAPKLADFGIETIDVRIKRADFPETIAESVYARMQAERKRIADRERAEGAERDAEVRANVDRQAAIIRAEAERDANIIRGEGEAESVRIFAEALQQDPDFYSFQRSLEAYSNFLSANTTVVLPADSDLFQFLQTPGGNLATREQPLNARLNGSTGGTPSAIVSNEFVAQAFVANDLQTNVADLTLVSSEAVDWPDASLGCAQPGSLAAQVITPGFKMVFDHNGQNIEVHTNQDISQIVICQN